MNKATVESIKSHAVRDYPKESCGVIVAMGRKELYIPCKNTSQTAGDDFAICPNDYSIAEDMGQVIAIVHSHPDVSAKPSEADIVSCENSGLPWVIVSVFADGVQEVRRIEPTGYVAPLIGRNFYYGVLDCFTIIQDFYDRQYGIHIERVESEDCWWLGDKEVYLDNFMDAGFVKVEDETLKAGDVLLMQVKSERTNHAAVFIGDTELKEAPGLFKIPDAMLHHFHGKLSERTAYQGYWRDVTRMVIRHKDLT